MPWDLIKRSIEQTHPFSVFGLRAMLAVPFFEKALYELPEEKVGTWLMSGRLCTSCGLKQGRSEVWGMEQVWPAAAAGCPAFPCRGNFRPICQSSSLKAACSCRLAVTHVTLGYQQWLAQGMQALNFQQLEH